jgi:hypothetical protein
MPIIPLVGLSQPKLNMIILVLIILLDFHWSFLFLNDHKMDLLKLIYGDACASHVNPSVL